MYTEQQLKSKVNEFALKYWNFKMDYDFDVTINGRLSRSLGKHIYYIKNQKTKSIQFSKNLIETDDQQLIDNIIKHETCHMVLFNTNKPHRDSDTFFKNEITRIGSSLSNTINLKDYVKQKHTTQKKQTPHKSVNNEIYTIITPGKRGITNAQMIPSIKTAINQNQTDHIIALKSHFPQVFNSSIKYLTKSEQSTMHSILNSISSYTFN